MPKCAPTDLRTTWIIRRLSGDEDPTSVVTGLLVFGFVICASVLGALLTLPFSFAIATPISGWGHVAGFAINAGIVSVWCAWMFLEAALKRAVRDVSDRDGQHLPAVLALLGFALATSFAASALVWPWSAASSTHWSVLLGLCALFAGLRLSARIATRQLRPLVKRVTLEAESDDGDSTAPALIPPDNPGDPAVVNSQMICHCACHDGQVFTPRGSI